MALLKVNEPFSSALYNRYKTLITTAFRLLELTGMCEVSLAGVH